MLCTVSKVNILKGSCCALYLKLMAERRACKNKMEIIHAEEYYIASIDLLGAKELIINDTDDIFLNQIKNIYKSWVKIKEDWQFSRLHVKIFSDNVVIAIKNAYSDAVDNLLEFVAYMAEHFLCCGYKPRGGICKGKLYIDETFVWGEGLVKAYLLESVKAIYPRIILDQEIISKSSKHLTEWMIFKDADGHLCLNYLKSFGGNKELWIKKIEDITSRTQKELVLLHSKLELAYDKNEKQKLSRVIEKIQWLGNFLDFNMKFWMSYET